MAETESTGAVRPVGRNPQWEKAQVRRVLHTTAFRRLPVRRHKVSGAGKTRTVTLFTVKPTSFSDEVKGAITSALSEALGKEVELVLMPEALAQAKTIRRTPLKVRHVLSLVRGKPVDKALAILEFTPNFAAKDVYKVVKSAAANAQDGWGADPEELVIHECFADQAVRMKRYRPGPMGRARPIQKLLSHITVIVRQAGR